MYSKTIFVFTLLVGSLKADTYTFNMKGDMGKLGVFTETVKVNGIPLTLSIRATSTYLDAPRSAEISVHNTKDQTTMVGVKGGTGHKKNITIDSSYHGNELQAQETLLISFNKPVHLKTYSVGNLLPGKELAIFSTPSGDEEMASQLTGTFHSSKPLKSGQRIRLTSKPNNTSGLSSICLKGLTVSIADIPRENKRQLREPSRKTAHSPNKRMNTKPLPSYVAIKSPSVQIWTKSDDQEIRAKLILIRNNDTLTFKTDSGNVLKLHKDELHPRSFKKAVRLARANLD